ncbi:MAG: PolC-type DNA polymerase III [Lachnospiraceae bacterium]|jgi:DNA polymerase-3 subunit epsilon
MTDMYVALDLETTGLQPKTDRILEIGAIKVVDGKIEDVYHTLIDPRMKIPAHITQITGITEEMVAGQKENEQAIRELLNFCEDLPLLGHNILFDYSFVKCSAVNLKLVFEKDGLDTLKIARCMLPELASRSLQYLREYYKIPQDKAHRALDDAHTTHLLYQKLKMAFGEARPDLFCPAALQYKAKRQSPITNAQKGYLQDLVKYHKISLNVEIESMTKSEASRMIDTLLSTYGRISKR